MGLDVSFTKETAKEIVRSLVKEAALEGATMAITEDGEDVVEYQGVGAKLVVRLGVVDGKLDARAMVVESMEGIKGAIQATKEYRVIQTKANMINNMRAKIK